MQGRVLWAGNACTDYWVYTKNNHALLGCLLCHPLDPFGRIGRLVILACGVMWVSLSNIFYIEIHMEMLFYSLPSLHRCV